jgi:hypothetical protein
MWGFDPDRSTLRFINPKPTRCQNRAGEAYNGAMNLRLLYGIFDPDNRDPEARIFRAVHHTMVAAGIATMLAETEAPLEANYSPVLDAGFYVVATFFCVE